MFLVTVTLLQHLQRALASVLRNVGGLRRMKEGRGPARSWKGGPINQLPWTSVVDLLLASRKEQEGKRAPAGNVGVEVPHPGKQGKENREEVQLFLWNMIQLVKRE